MLRTLCTGSGAIDRLHCPQLLVVSWALYVENNSRVSCPTSSHLRSTPAEVSSSAGAFQVKALRANQAEHPNLTQQHMSAYQGRVIAYWIAQVTAPGPGLEYDVIRHAAFQCLVVMDVIFRRALADGGTSLSSVGISQAQEAGLGFLTCYNWLASKALERKELCWKLMPKHHALHHLLLDFLGVGNPRMLHNYADEDLVRTCMSCP